jgi:hypothetical protein
VGGLERAAVTSYSVRGTLTAIELDLGNADAEIVGGREAPVVDVRRTDAFAFHRPAAAERRVSDGTLAPALTLPEDRARVLLGVLPPHRAQQCARDRPDSVG